jgi:HEPN domain-containing protein
LLNASSDDEEVLKFDVPGGIFGQHSQAAVEKLYKALLTAHDHTYPFKHDLVLLHSLLVAEGETLPLISFPLEDLTEYAGQMQYERPMAFPDEERSRLREDIRRLREFCLRRIAELKPHSLPRGL